mmetsp:Transcript_78501/g.173876  ORF Transcript_78501/g.173876 Transcript_78501/m.173876 type:complete len:153 (-) Transcript_78501:35-493(-)
MQSAAGALTWWRRVLLPLQARTMRKATIRSAMLQTPPPQTLRKPGKSRSRLGRAAQGPRQTAPRPAPVPALPQLRRWLRHLAKAARPALSAPVAALAASLLEARRLRICDFLQHAAFNGLRGRVVVKTCDVAVAGRVEERGSITAAFGVGVE